MTPKKAKTKVKAKATKAKATKTKAKAKATKKKSVNSFTMSIELAIEILGRDVVSRLIDREKLIMSRLSDADRATILHAAKSQRRNSTQLREPYLVSLSPTELRQVMRMPHSDYIDGFQRSLSPHRTLAIGAHVWRGKSLPPLIVGELPVGEEIKSDFGFTRRIMIDGDHRKDGGLQANVPLTAVIIPIENLDEARQSYLEINALSVRVTSKDQLHASKNASATNTKSLCADFGLSEAQALAVCRGAAGKINLVDTRASLNAVVFGKCRVIAAAWSADQRFQQEHPVFSSPRAFTVLGTLSRTINTENLREALEFLRAPAQRQCWHQGKVFDRRNNAEMLAALDSRVKNHLLGGTAQGRRRKKR